MIKSDNDDILFNYKQCHESGDLILTYYTYNFDIGSIKSHKCQTNPYVNICVFDFDNIDGTIIKIIINYESVVMLTDAEKIYRINSREKITQLVPNINIKNIYNGQCDYENSMLILDTVGQLWRFKSIKKDPSVIEFNLKISVADVDVHTNVLLDTNGILYHYDLSACHLMMADKTNSYKSMYYNCHNHPALLNTKNELIDYVDLSVANKIPDGSTIKFYSVSTHINRPILVSNINDELFLFIKRTWYPQENFLSDSIIDIRHHNNAFVIATNNNLYFCSIDTHKTDPSPKLVLKHKTNNYSHHQSNIKSAAKV